MILWVNDNEHFVAVIKLDGDCFDGKSLDSWLCFFFMENMFVTQPDFAIEDSVDCS